MARTYKRFTMDDLSDRSNMYAKDQRRLERIERDRVRSLKPKETLGQEVRSERIEEGKRQRY